MAEKVDFSEIAVAGYSSDFDSDAESRKRKVQYESLLPKKRKRDAVPNSQELGEQYTREEGKIHRIHYLSMSAFDRHKQFVNNYIQYFGGSMKDFGRDRSRDRNDMDVIRDNHRFLWDDDDEDSEDNWEKDLAKKYYDKLFKEYCLADLSRYKENKIGMRWRTETEVVDGKGQFVCGSKKCVEREGLRSWEVNFAYVEHGEKKNALVKLRLCPECSYKLNYHHKRKEVLPEGQQKNKSKKEKKHKKHKKDKHGNSSGEEEGGGGGEKGESSKAKSDDKQDQQEEASNIWSGPAKVTEEKSRVEEFDDYFSDMFL